MRKIVFSIMTLLPLLVAAEDIIVLTNGDIVRAKVMEISQTEVKYKKASNLDGPVYTVSKADVLSINYENGESDKFGPTTSKEQTNAGVTIKAQPDSDNAALKALYSQGTYSSSKKISSKPAKSASLFYKFTDNSVVSSKELSIKFEPGYCFKDQWHPKNGKVPGYIVRRIANLQYRIHLTNKTDKPIYLDLGKSSKHDEINGFLTYYDGSSIVNSTGETTGTGIHLGPIAIGGASTESTSIVDAGNRYITIPPHSNFIIPAKKKILPVCTDPYTYYETFTNYIETVPFGSRFSDLTERESKFYTEDESPVKVNYTLTYSTTSDFANPIELDFSLYAFQAIGLPYLWDKIGGGFRDTYKNFNGLDDTFIGGSIMFDKNWTW